MKYPFTKCNHPKRIFNKHTHEPLGVGCGVCSSCLVSKADKASLLCSLEESDNKYCVFVTLTYSNKYIPKFKIIDDGNNVYLKNYCTRSGFSSLGVDGVNGVLDYVPSGKRGLYTKSYITLLESKCNLGGYLGYCNTRDVQLFLKRFRKQLSKYSYEKIRYYAVSEYGPVHFRPHYHLLLFFNEKITFQNYRKVLYKSWPFGRIDASISRGKCSSYVAQYINSFSSLPGLFALRSVRPFCLHSVRFAQGFYKDKAKEIYKNAFSRFVRTSRVIGAKNVSFCAWRSLKTTFYPRCSEYNFKSVSELYYSYTILLQAYRRYGKKGITQLTKEIVSDVLQDEKKLFYDSYGRLDDSKCSKDLLIMYFRKSSCDDACLPSRVASDLYLSKHFLIFCVPNMYPNEDYTSSFVIHKAVEKIISFYNFVDLFNLASMYDSMNDYYEEYHDIYGYIYYYNNFPLLSFDDVSNKLSVDASKFNYYCSRSLPYEFTNFLETLCLTYYSFYMHRYSKFENLPIVQEFRGKSVVSFDSHMKHKKLNDANNIFCLDV